MPVTTTTTTEAKADMRQKNRRIFCGFFGGIQWENGLLLLCGMERET